MSVPSGAGELKLKLDDLDYTTRQEEEEEEKEEAEQPSPNNSPEALLRNIQRQIKMGKLRGIAGHLKKFQSSRVNLLIKTLSYRLHRFHYS